MTGEKLLQPEYQDRVKTGGYYFTNCYSKEWTTSGKRGRKQSKPGVGSSTDLFRQMLGLRLSQDRRESLVLFWIPGKI